MEFARFAMLAGQMLIGIGAVIPGPLLEAASTGDVGQVEKLMNRAREYMVAQRGIDASRLSVVNGGYREEDSVELWIVPSGAAPPQATPTVQAGEVKRRKR